MVSAFSEAAWCLWQLARSRVYHYRSGHIRASQVAARDRGFTLITAAWCASKMTLPLARFSAPSLLLTCILTVPDTACCTLGSCRRLLSQLFKVTSSPTPCAQALSVLILIICL